MSLQRLPDPLPSGIEAYRLDFDLSCDETPHWPLLSAVEQARAGRFMQSADRLRFSATRTATRQLLARRLSCQPVDLPLAQDAYGKPFVDMKGAVPLFNVSHSGSHALIALADSSAFSSVGIDIEQRRAGLDVDALSEAVLTDLEKSAVVQAADPQEALLQRWVGKEAVLKAIGVGIAEHLRCVGIHPGPEGRWVLETTVPEWSDVEAMPVAAPSGYAAALAWRSRVQNPG
ncbi:4'-phosphopantetheinyl transferase superfamily protein [Acidovorax sp. SUPP3334]|uniref:4'-phosphopantetheinyl transferase family protein n=1 Tax=Acidovorax sp. SUPP3334 TaxID=2920881 RepID=UPI0023DE2A74|nr:4'-phosphopantetheinyl transferase superfamily protein [Acidovorax sp. SUPP3334]GKT25812.1 4'-phosphopantetheinyl transferase superfamily protein [Acidovorax sp. SUPP3334]